MFKNIDRWIGSYIQQSLARTFIPVQRPKPVHIMFACVDHFEPEWRGADEQTQLERIYRWTKNYPKLVDSHKDSEGRRPKHSFFYPAEVYNPQHLDLLANFCRRGYGEVEIHLHHDGDTEESLTAKLETAKKDFSRHGLLSRKKMSDRPHYGFIHGNWALNNSRKDGKWCGVNNELKILKETGCYADFTFPSAPSDTQPPKINSIYYASSNAKRPCGHHRGVAASVGQISEKDLLLIQGPTALNWSKRSRGIFPSIENADICGTNPPTPARADLWVKQHIHVHGKEDWIFIKLHTHGAQPGNADILLEKPMNDLFSDLEKRYNDGHNYRLHYVTAREMYNIIKAAEAGESGDPAQYRDYILLSNLNVAS